jgi:hypothetical protein
MDSSQLPEARVAEMIAGVAAYLRQERDLYFKASEPLTPIWKSAVQPYFSNTLIECVRIVTLEGARIPPPPFYSEAMAMSQGSFPDFVHLASFTYIDVIVFNDQITSRPLFHGLVHVAQMVVLGLDRYVDLYVRGFVKHRSWIAIPLEAQAFQLDARFAMSPADIFLMETEIRLWAEGGRYQ